MTQQLVHFVEWKKVSDEDFEGVLKDLCEWGVMDIVAHPVWKLRDLKEPGYLRKKADKIKEYGLKTSACHALWGADYDIGCPEEGHSRALQEHMAFLRQLVEMDVKTYTIHVNFQKSEEFDVNWARITKSVEALLPVLSETGIKLALENGGNMMIITKIAEWLQEMNHPQLGMCFDTGHANCYSPVGIYGTLEIMKPVIVTCHMHDNFGSQDDHNPPGSGNTDWTKMIPALKACPNMLHAETESGDWGKESWNAFQKVWNQ